MNTTQQIVAIILGVCSILALGGAWWYKFGRPLAAMSEAMLGRPEVKDRSGAVLQEPQPGMPAQVASLAADVREALDVKQDVAVLKVDIAALKQDVAGLKDARTERVASHIESATAFDAIAAVAKSLPED